MSITDLTKRVREIKELEMMIAELESEIDTIKDELKAEMTARETEELAVDVFKIRYKTVKSNRVDTTALKKELPDVAARYTKTSEVKKFTIT